MLDVPRKKVAVLGTSTSTLTQAPVNDPEWEIWACSPWMQGRMVPRSEDVAGFDSFFEIHWKDQFHPGEKEHFIPWLAECGKPVWVFDDLGIPTQVMYPREQMLAQHGAAFFTSTIAWMLALAIEQRPPQIGIWGVDMADDTEYSHQKQGCLHFISLARLVGIDVVLPPASELLVVPKPYPDRYRTEQAKTLQRKLDQALADQAILEDALKQVEKNKHDVDIALAAKRGEIETLRHLQRVLL